MTTETGKSGGTAGREAGGKDPVAEARKRLEKAEAEEKKAQTDLGAAETLAKASAKETQKLKAQLDEVTAQWKKAADAETGLRQRQGWLDAVKRFAGADALIKSLELAAAVAGSEYGKDSDAAAQAQERLDAAMKDLQYEEVKKAYENAKKNLEESDQEQKKEKERAELRRKLSDKNGQLEKKDQEKTAHDGKGKAIAEDIKKLKEEVDQIKKELGEAGNAAA